VPAFVAELNVATDTSADLLVVGSRRARATRQPAVGQRRHPLAQHRELPVMIVPQAR
jgi:nucleotide-binding universal stress UspA family protein